MINSVEIPLLGYSIAGDWYEGDTADRILFVLPGYTSSRIRQKEIVAALIVKTGASALVIDYTGHGDSPFQLKYTRPAQHALEVIAAFDWIKVGYPKAQISIVSTSYGSFLATHLAKYRKFENLVLRAPAIYKPDSFYDLWSKRLSDESGYRQEIQKYRRDTKELSESPLLGQAFKFTGRTLVVVHSEDKLIPTQTTDAFADAFNADIMIASGFEHSLSQSHVTSQQLQDYYNQIADWITIK